MDSILGPCFSTGRVSQPRSSLSPDRRHRRRSGLSEAKTGVNRFRYPVLKHGANIGETE